MPQGVEHAELAAALHLQGKCGGGVGIYPLSLTLWIEG
jgi:hypothetical protein